MPFFFFIISYNLFINLKLKPQSTTILETFFIAHFIIVAQTTLEPNYPWLIECSLSRLMIFISVLFVLKQGKGHLNITFERKVLSSIKLGLEIGNVNLFRSFQKFERLVIVQMFPGLLWEVRKVLLHIERRISDVFEIFSLAEKEVFICARLIPVCCCFQYLLEIHFNVSILVLPNLTLVSFWLCLWSLPCRFANFCCSCHFLNAFQ